MIIEKYKKIIILTAIVLFVPFLIYVKPVFAIITPSAIDNALFSQNFRKSALEAIKTMRLTYSKFDRTTQESNFEKGEKVYVRIKIFEPGSSTNIKLTDRIFDFKPGSITNFKYNGDDISGVSVDEAKNQLNVSIQTKNGANYFDYEYEVSD